MRTWLSRLGVKTLYIEPGSPWENGYVESFNGKLRDEVLNREVFDTLLDAKVLVERWRREYNHILPYGSSGGSPEWMRENPEDKEVSRALLHLKIFLCMSDAQTCRYPFLPYFKQVKT